MDRGLGEAGERGETDREVVMASLSVPAASEAAGNSPKRRHRSAIDADGVPWRLAGTAAPPAAGELRSPAPRNGSQRVSTALLFKIGIEEYDKVLR